MKIERVGVLGAGLMGAGIAEVAAKAGYETLVREVTEDLGRKGLSRIEGSMARAVEKGKLEAAARDAALAKLSTTTRLEDLSGCDIVLEAIVESLDAKTEAFGTLDRVCKPETIFCSNTSSLTITEMSAATSRPDRFAGLHFFNPVPVMKLVEVVRGLHTSDATLKTSLELCERFGKTPVEVHDFPGFVSNRVLMPMINEAVFALQEGVASKEGIDAVMKLGMNHPMGPLELADFIGLDTCLQIMEVLYHGFRDSKYRAAPLLRKMVSAGLLGKKSGRGFYEYT